MKKHTEEMVFVFTNVYSSDQWIYD
jgi:hypothetical protein